MTLLFLLQNLLTADISVGKIKLAGERPVIILTDAHYWGLCPLADS